ncbi:MAG: hypothetical protein Q9172_005263 [Xanthocarpia lactea]
MLSLSGLTNTPQVQLPEVKHNHQTHFHQQKPQRPRSPASNVRNMTQSTYEYQPKYQYVPSRPSEAQQAAHATSSEKSPERSSGGVPSDFAGTGSWLDAEKQRYMDAIITAARRAQRANPLPPPRIEDHPLRHQLRVEEDERIKEYLEHERKNQAESSTARQRQ